MLYKNLPPSRVTFLNQPSVWLEFSPLAKLTNSINLGQGFPDWAPPDFVQVEAIKSVQGGRFSTYARSAGHGNLVESLAENYSESLNHSIHPYQEILTTVGASEALFLSIMSFVDVDDEVIIIEPAFDIYLGALKMAQANIKTVSLISNNNLESANDLELDWEKLELILSDKTKLLILNTPHNPTGKVFRLDELQKLAKLLEKFPNCIVVSDEVYEHLTFDNSKHISFASLPGMFKKTVTISSAGKTFSTTGWKVGWAIGPKELIKRLQLCQQWVVFSISTPHQEAIAESLKIAKTNNYYPQLRKEYEHKRNFLYEGLKNLGLNPILPQGSFFIICDISQIKTNNLNLKQLEKWHLEGKIEMDTTTQHLRDYNFCRELTLKKQVTAIPVSAFYLNKSDNQAWIRFAFCKDNQTLSDALTTLKHKL